jgi:hypothetical protein
MELSVKLVAAQAVAHVLEAEPYEDWGIVFTHQQTTEMVANYLNKNGFEVSISPFLRCRTRAETRRVAKFLKATFGDDLMWSYNIDPEGIVGTAPRSYKDYWKMARRQTFFYGK